MKRRESCWATTGRLTGVRKKLLLICLWLLLIRTTFVFAQGDTPSSRLTLSGLTGVSVRVVEKTGCPGISSTMIKIEAELELRKVGIKILEENALSPNLSIWLTCHPAEIKFPTIETGGYAFTSRVFLMQSIPWPRLPSKPYIDAVTWDAIGSIGFYSNQNSQVIRESIRDNIKQFNNAWLSANPRNK